ncbi:hypothetical protein GCM10011585_30420 [Edaphobacter dinghuensis]|uniref:Uncharacterized protein n=1 Tax=Edaphobacter dinghuensis TaxID=1560005 RepID=A0A917MA23_9BACT|nr:hypothetical protein GCM10011585_30420 [Edaphobacter dinghuensis]
MDTDGQFVRLERASTFKDIDDLALRQLVGYFVQYFGQYMHFLFAIAYLYLCVRKFDRSANRGGSMDLRMRILRNSL